MIRPRFLFALFALGACLFAAYAPAYAQSAAAPQVPLIEPAQVKGLMALGGKLTIVDVRRPDEFAQGHIAGAILMPLDSLPQTYAKLPKKGKLIVYCRSGHRSGLAVQFLAEHGYTNAVSMHGGFIAWSQN